MGGGMGGGGGGMGGMMVVHGDDQSGTMPLHDGHDDLARMIMYFCGDPESWDVCEALMIGMRWAVVWAVVWVVVWGAALGGGMEHGGMGGGMQGPCRRPVCRSPRGLLARRVTCRPGW